MVASAKKKMLCFQSGTSVANRVSKHLAAQRSTEKWPPVTAACRARTAREHVRPVAEEYPKLIKAQLATFQIPNKTNTTWPKQLSFFQSEWQFKKLSGNLEIQYVHCTYCTNLAAPGKKPPAAVLDKDLPSCQCSEGEGADHDHSGTLNLDMDDMATWGVQLR